MAHIASSLIQFKAGRLSISVRLFIAYNKILEMSRESWGFGSEKEWKNDEIYGFSAILN